MKAQFDMFAGYNAWANARLFAAARQLPDADYRANRGAYFKSVHGTLNHLLVADRIWMHRFTGEGEAGYRLDTILFNDLASLEAARLAEDKRIIAYAASLDDEKLGGMIHYRRVSTPEPISQRLAPALSHFFNHQTHHRGQIHALLTGLVGTAPELDLLFYQRAAGL